MWFALNNGKILLHFKNFSRVVSLPCSQDWEEREGGGRRGVIRDLQQQHLVCSLCMPKLFECPRGREIYPPSPIRHRYAEKMVQDLDRVREEVKLIIRHTVFTTYLLFFYFPTVAFYIEFFTQETRYAIIDQQWTTCEMRCRACGVENLI